MSTEEEDNRWNTDPLTEIQIAQVAELMKINPVADQTYVETIVRLGTAKPDRLKEIVDKKKRGEYKEEPVRLTEEELTLKCVDILDEDLVKV